MLQGGLRSVESRIVGYDQRARMALGGAVLLAFLAVATAVAFAFVLSQIIARVFIDANTLRDVRNLLLFLCALALLRAGFLWAVEVAAQSAASRGTDRSISARRRSRT